MGKKALIVLLIGLYIGISNISCNIAFAESRFLTEAKKKVDHITKSLTNNYLGLKNQSQWELYIKQSRELIKKVPKGEVGKAKALTDEVNRAEALVKALARINHVEKSMTPKEQGGYGNALIPKNVPQWKEYIRLANVDLSKVNLKVFKPQHTELIHRRDVVNVKLQKILEEEGLTETVGTIKNYSANGYNIKRMYSKDVFENAVVISQEYKRGSESGDLCWGSEKKPVDTIILVDKNDIWSGSLSGSLVYKYNAPIMFLDGDNIPTTTEKGITDLKFKNVVLVSSTGNSLTNTEGKLKAKGIVIKDKIVENDRYLLSFKIAEKVGLGEKNLLVNTIDADTDTSFDRLVTQQTMSAYSHAFILLPTKGKTVEEIASYNGYLTMINNLYKKNKTIHRTTDKSLFKIVDGKMFGGMSDFIGGYAEFEGNNYYINTGINAYETINLKKTSVFMAHGNNKLDQIALMPLAILNEAPLLYGGDQPSITIKDTSRRKIMLEERYNKDSNPVNKVYILGNEATLKNGVEKKLRGEDY
ncbi:MAG: hypothetical protein RR840_08085 [Clostridium sp.]